MNQEPPRTVRYRRRRVVPIRWTWIGQVSLLLFLVHQLVIRMGGIDRITTQAALFIAIVVVPLVLLVLWRLGLLPPERVVGDETPEPPEQP